MGKRCAWAIAIGLVLLGGAWNSAAGHAYDVINLKSVCIQMEDLSADVKREFGLSKKTIENYVYVSLKGKLPRLRIELYTGTLAGACLDSTRAPQLWVTITIKKIPQRAGYFGAVELDLTRPARWESGEDWYGISYSKTSILSGPMGKAREHINLILDELLTDFAAVYYKAGNP